MRKCYTPCIYYYEDKSKFPYVRTLCDIREGEELKNITSQEIDNCKHFKTYNKNRNLDKTIASASH